MYKATYKNGDSEEVVFYSDKYPLDEYRILDPSLDLKDSEAGSFTVTLPPTNIAYSEFERMKTEITIYDGDEEIFDGRLLSDTYDFYNNRQCTFEGALSYLIDTSQPQMEYNNITVRQFVEAIISVHNNKVPEHKRFTVAVISNNLMSGNGGSYVLSYRATQFGSTLEALNSLVSDLQGHIQYKRELNTTTGKKERKLYIWDESDFINTSGQSINFGENLLEFSKGYDMSDLCSVLVATGQRESSPDQAVPGDELIVFDDLIGDPTRIGKTAYNNLPPETKASGYYILDDQSDPDSYTTIMYQNPNSSVVYLPVYRRMYKGNQVYHARPNVCMYNTKVDNNDQLNFGMVEQNYYLSDPIKIEENQTYFLSYRVDKSKQYVMYMITRSNDLTSRQNILEYKYVSSSGEYGVEDAIKVAVTMPEGANYIYLCGVGRDIPIQCQASKDSLEKLDTYLTLQGAEGTEILPSGSTLIDKKPGTTENLTQAFYENSIPDSTKHNSDNWFYIWDTDRLYHWVQDDEDPAVWTEYKFKDGIYMINPYLVEEYGWIEKTASWDDIADSETLMLYAFSYLFREQWDKLSISLTAFDLRMLGVDADKFRLYHLATVNSKPHGINNLALPILEMQIPLLNPESTTFQLGYDSEQSFTEASNNANTDILQQILAAPTFSETVESAKINASNLIAAATTGTITLIQSENGPDELLIHDGAGGNYHRAVHLWRWNINGLMFAQVQDPLNPGYDEAYNASHAAGLKAAITRDGQITADFITTGYMYADRIQGGSLSLGGYTESGQSTTARGKLTVYDYDAHTPSAPTYSLLVGETGNYDGTWDASKYGVSINSRWMYATDWYHDVIQLDDGHLYMYMSDYTGDYLGENKHKKAITSMFMARGNTFDGPIVQGVALNIQTPMVVFNGPETNNGPGDTKVEIDGYLHVTGNTELTGTLDVGADVSLGGYTKLVNAPKVYYNGDWTNGASATVTAGNVDLHFEKGIYVGSTSNNNQSSGSGSSGGSSSSGNTLTIGNTSINETQLQALLNLLGGTT